ncbi:MAG: energy-coupling factor transport system substrate-specific component [Thermoanaerobacteraceae bacterium]|jgi:energy-coupling factor transport system substrate-specific component|nr:energy-coupling factor transport system substrate-specific component [Thermoanaerobacteraceae bacterium]
MFSIIIAIIFLSLMYLSFEKSHVSSKEVALTAVLGTVAAMGRIAFAALPNIQAATFIIIVAGSVMGWRAGFVVGATAALVSNFFLGQGPWTIWQMLAWGIAGASAGIIKRAFPNIGRAGMTVFCFLWGYFFGWIMNLWYWSAFIRPLSIKSFMAACLASFWFDSFHAVGNAILYLCFGVSFTKILKRFHRRLKVTVYYE